MTQRQKTANSKRLRKIADRMKRDKDYCAVPCIGCYSGIVPWNQGSDYCSACLKRDRP